MSPSPAVKKSVSRQSATPASEAKAAPAVQPAPTTQVPASNGKTNVLAILSLIFAFLIPIVGFVLAIIALVHLHKHPKENGKGLAIAGLIVSIVMFLLFIVLIFIGMMAYFGVLSPARMMY